MGATPTREDADATLNISIHAPAWGATKRYAPIYGNTIISIHAPAWGATCRAKEQCKARYISIHAPAWGATLGGAEIFCGDYKFQSTLPRGERRPIGERGSAVACISIHAPAWGATIAPYINDPTFSISIHAPAWGATHYACVKIHCFLNFNPRSRVGSDIGRGLKKSEQNHFNPRSRVGSDRLWRKHQARFYYFNPRSRVGSDG